MTDSGGEPPRPVASRPEDRRQWGRGSLTADRRGASISITHVLTLGITAVLVAGLLLAAGTFLDTQRERAVEQNIRVVGERLADEFVQVDRLLAGGGREAGMRTVHLDRLGDQRYTVQLVHEGTAGCPDTRPVTDACLVLETTAPETTYVVELMNESRVTPSTASGGNVRFVTDGGSISVESGGV